MTKTPLRFLLIREERENKYLIYLNDLTSIFINQNFHLSLQKFFIIMSVGS